MRIASHTRQRTTRQLGRWGALVVLLAPLGACGDQTKVIAPKPSRIQHSLADAPTVIDSAWDHYAADVSIDATGGEDSRMPTRAPRHVAYHVDRALGANGVWTTTVSYEPQPELGPVAPKARRWAVARVEAADDGSVLRAYDRDGHLLQQPDPSRLPPPIRDQLARHGAPPDRKAGKGSPNADPRGWLSNVVSTPTTRDRARGRLQALFGPAADRRGALERYTKTRGKRTYEQLLDPALGAIVEENVDEDGVRTEHRTHAYTQISDGVYVRSLTRLERAPQDKEKSPTVIEYTLANVRLEKRGGTK